VTAGRLLFALIQRWFPSRLAYHLLPFVLAGAFVLISVLPSRSPTLSVLAFALAGFGCSALLPLTISFGQEKLVSMSAAMAGLVIAFYQVGYGIAAFGVGPLRHAGSRCPACTASAPWCRGPGPALAGRRARPPVAPLRASPAAASGTSQPASELIS